jgi:hypothetical protein
MTDTDLPFLDQTRDDQGRFAPKQEAAPAQEPAPPPEPKEQPPAPVTNPEPQAQPPSVEPPTVHARPPDGYIPIAAVLDEREKRQALQRERDDWQRKFEEATKQPPPAPIDPIADPEGFERDLQDRFRKAEWDATTRVSLGFAVKQHGAEAVKAAETWVAEMVQANPAFFQTIQAQSDPYDFVVRQHKRHLSLSKMGEDDPETWASKWAEQNGYVKADQSQGQVSAGNGASSQQPAPLPKPSLASAPAASGSALKIPVGQGVAFDEVFKR